MFWVPIQVAEQRPIGYENPMRFVQDSIVARPG